MQKRVLAEQRGRRAEYQIVVFIRRQTRFQPEQHGKPAFLAGFSRDFIAAQPFFHLFLRRAGQRVERLFIIMIGQHQARIACAGIAFHELLRWHMAAEAGFAAVRMQLPFHLYSPFFSPFCIDYSIPVRR